MKRFTITLILCIAASGASAHQDRRLSLSSGGAIPELPPRYAATRVQIEFSKGRAGRLTKLTLTSVGKSTVVKGCLLELVPASSRKGVALAGSWYHDKQFLPDYIQVLFKTSPLPPGLPEEPGVLFLFSLEDARLPEVKKIVPLPQEHAVEYQEIALHDGCPGKP